MLVTNRDSWVGTDWYDCCILTRTILAIQGLSSQLDLLKDASVFPHTDSHWLLKGYNQLQIVFGCFDMTCGMSHVTVEIQTTPDTQNSLMETTMWTVPNHVISTPGFSLRATALCPNWRFRGPRKFSANSCCCRTLKTARMAVAAASTLVAGGQEVIYLLQLIWGQQLFFTNKAVD